MRFFFLGIFIFPGFFFAPGDNETKGDTRCDSKTRPRLCEAIGLKRLEIRLFYIKAVTKLWQFASYVVLCNFLSDQRQTRNMQKTKTCQKWSVPHKERGHKEREWKNRFGEEKNACKNAFSFMQACKWPFIQKSTRAPEFAVINAYLTFFSKKSNWAYLRKWQSKSNRPLRRKLL